MDTTTLKIVRHKMAEYVARWGLLVVAVILLGMTTSLLQVAKLNTELLRETEQKAATIATLRAEVDELRLLVCVMNARIDDIDDVSLPSDLQDRIEERCLS